jgi:predicted ATPase
VITECEIEGFKSLQKVRLKLGGFNLFIGANASGKSNFFEALRVFEGLGYGFKIDEIFNGKPKSATSEVWEPIRGGSAKARFFGREETKPAIEFSVEFQNNGKKVTYSVGIVPEKGEISSERFAVNSKPIFTASFSENLRQTVSSALVSYQDEDGEFCSTPVEESKSALHQLAAYHYFSVHHSDTFRNFTRALSNFQEINPSPEVLRGYSQARSVGRIGGRGENFAALVKTIFADDNFKSAYLAWLRHLTPMELEDVTVLEGALGEPLFALRERDNILPAPILSDGTLRFAAIAAAFFQSDMPNVIKIEEIENGIHPNRLRLLIELLKSQSRAGGSGPQVFATTHSPIALAWLEESDYQTTFLCRRDEETGASIIKPISEIPFLLEIVKKQPISDLFAEGWLEGAF